MTVILLCFYSHMYKRCSSCKKEIDTTKFNPNRTRPDGLQTICKVCDSARCKAAYEARKQKNGHHCVKCLSILPLDRFEITPKGYRRKTCKECLLAKQRVSRKERKKNRGTRAVKWEKSLASAVLHDCRRSDKKKERDNDLTLSVVRELLDNPCVYCGETKIRMSLDRIDNDKGHSKDNVNPSCVRCNLTRGSMPYEAWLCVVDGMREAREKGLFGEWVGRTGLKERIR